ncbi:PfaD family polyunsaturated fatty acid/polyketide biosynthesis protein [Desulfoluna spongiiphila]|uniref:PfaD family polyunsaturated fatty acid/polyketide biosynthesis protein n=1 Tax=Desulfoluna spongiiphila TaxID=419481 RepID=UPI00125794AA|nr:PfaD family polyunsaturated fatty acid/polyketide biosynthesis protein [Desulfoluna spongiiphila]VVS93415.1 aldolase-type tim barrel [Desulfoluna spongiiphila]
MLESVPSWWRATSPDDSAVDIRKALETIDSPFFLVDRGNGPEAHTSGEIRLGCDKPGDQWHPALATVRALPISALGSRSFLKRHGLRFPYVMGAMANGITSEAMVEAAGKNGMMGFFGSGGCTLPRIKEAIARLKQAAETKPFPFGFNFLHHHGAPEAEMALCELYLNEGIRCVSAAAFLTMTLALVRYRVTGIHLGEDGRVVTPNKVIAKLSREELAEKFMSPPPAEILNKLHARGLITDTELALAPRIPMADDITAEADSGGHTDNRPALALLPAIQAVRDRMMATHGYPEKIGVGLAGGIAAPVSATAAYAMGADYILTGTINQGCREAGTSDKVKALLAQARQADVTMAPAADMFEMGGKVQVLKRGTMFAMRAAKLLAVYQSARSLDDIADADRAFVETKILGKPVHEVWNDTKTFFDDRDPTQVAKAETDPRHKMALVFRSYLGQASLWAIQGLEKRSGDYQIWCGPAIGAFNAWTHGTPLAGPENRDVTTVAFNLLIGASVEARSRILASQYPSLAGFRFLPKTSAELAACSREID